MLEPVLIQVGGDSAATVEHVELGGRLGQLVVKEVPRSGVLAFIEVPGI